MLLEQHDAVDDRLAVGADIEIAFKPGGRGARRSGSNPSAGLQGRGENLRYTAKSFRVSRIAPGGGGDPKGQSRPAVPPGA